MGYHSSYILPKKWLACILSEKSEHVHNCISVELPGRQVCVCEKCDQGAVAAMGNHFYAPALRPGERDRLYGCISTVLSRLLILLITHQLRLRKGDEDNIEMHPILGLGG